jgi:predicted lipoprotein with Yx(FWY)xxD motif
MDAIGQAWPHIGGFLPVDRTSQRLRSPKALIGILVGAALALAACSSGSSPYAPAASTVAAASAAPSSAAAAASAAPAASSAAAAAPGVNSVSDPTLGAYLTGLDGRTLYVLTKDSAGTSTCSGTCATNWPPFTLGAGETVKAGAGVTGTFATTTRADGTMQVTYQGAPLYYFANDAKAGDVNGQGIGGVWFVAATSGGPGGSVGASPSASTGGRGY